MSQTSLPVSYAEQLKRSANTPPIAITPKAASMAAAFYRRANDEDKAGEEELALAHLKQAIALAPDRYDYYLLAGDTQLHAGNKSAAYDFFKKAWSANCRNRTQAETSALDILLRLTPKYFEDHKTKELLSLLKPIMDNTHTSDAYILSAKCHADLGEIKQAESDYKEVLKNPKRLVVGSIELAHLYLREKKPQNALAVLSHAIEFITNDPKKQSFYDHISVKLFNERAKCYEALGDADLAKRDLKRFAEFSSELDDVLPFLQR